MTIVRIELDPYLFNKKGSEDEKITWIILNVGLNCDYYKTYNWLEETKMWARGGDYFPDLSWEEFLAIARKYSFWNTWEKQFLLEEDK